MLAPRRVPAETFAAFGHNGCKSAGSGEEYPMAKYGKTAKREVKKALHKTKRGQQVSGKSGKKVTSRKQAIAIGLSKARKKGGKVPPRPRKK
jgi:hypothetical protein